LDREVRKFEAEKAAILDKTREASLEKLAEADEYAEIVKAELKALLTEAGDLANLAAPEDSAAASGPAARAKGGASSRGDLYRRLDENRKAIRRLDGEFRNIGAKDGGKRGRKASRAGTSSGRSFGNIDPTTLRVGDTVHLATLGMDGEVATPPDDKGELQILAGRVRMTVRLSDLRSVKENSPGGAGGGKSRPARRGAARSYGAASGSGGGAHIRLSKANSVSSSFDVHGFTLDDAVMAVDKYIDDAMLAGYGEVAVVHGRGEGILRTGLRKMLRQHKHVKKVRPGGPGEGGEGATIVTLR
jgi:DNA mismatch repair protein MutS2